MIITAVSVEIGASSWVDVWNRSRLKTLRAFASKLTSSLKSGIPRVLRGLNRIARLLGTEDSEGL